MENKNKYREFSHYDIPTLLGCAFNVFPLNDCNYSEDLSVKCHVGGNYTDKNTMTMETMITIMRKDNPELEVDDKLVCRIIVQQILHWKEDSGDRKINTEVLQKYIWHSFEMCKAVITNMCFLMRVDPIVLSVSEDDIHFNPEDDGQFYADQHEVK